MNMDMEKKRAAALAAVTCYIKTCEEGAAALAASQAPSTDTRHRHESPWGAGGRMQQMQMRTHMQLKAFHR